MDFLWQDMASAAFWIAVVQIIGANIILSGDNAVVIAMACMTLPPKQRLWGMVLGAAVAVLLRVLFTLVVAQAMSYPYLKIVGGILLLWVAYKLVAEDAGGEGGDHKSGENLWRAVRIVAIADIVMSLDNVIAIAASAEVAASGVDLAHPEAIKATLIVFGLATSIPLIVGGSAILMALLERFRILVWAGGALLGWVAGDIMATDPAVATWASPALAHTLHDWGGPIGALLVVAAGYVTVKLQRPLHIDEIMAGAYLVVWIAADRVTDGLAHGDLLVIWAQRGVLLALMVVVYAAARMRMGKRIEEA